MLFWSQNESIALRSVSILSIAEHTQPGCTKSARNCWDFLFFFHFCFRQSSRKKIEDLCTPHCHGNLCWLAASLQMATGVAMGHLCSDFFFPQQMAVTSLIRQENPCLRALSCAELLFGIILGGRKYFNNEYLNS